MSSARLSGAKRPRASAGEAADDAPFNTEELKRSMEIDDSYMILGIDEAGRGPVLGPMVYTGLMISLGEHGDLVQLCHVADSKTLNEERRQQALQRLHELKTMQAFTVVISPAEISAAMLGRRGRNLNTLSHETAVHIISQATLAALGKLCAVYVDTVGPPEVYQDRLSGRFPHLRATVAKKADSKFPVVSAASIVAKTTRDELITRIGADVGCGYPSDPRTVAWVRSHVHRFFVFTRANDFVRQSWAPVVQLAKDANICIPVVFEQDEENEKRRGRGGGDGAAPSLVGQTRLSFAAPPPRRHAVLTHLLKLHPVTSIGF